MKKFLVYLLMAILGGFISLVAYMSFYHKEKITEIRPEQAITVPANFTNYKTGGVPQLGPDFVMAAELTVNAVVHIRTEYSRKSSVYDYFFHDFYDFFGDRRRESSPRQSPIVATGSGVIISEGGYIVTNNHVVQEAELIKVTLNDKREFTARIVGTDPTTDLAVIKIEAKNLPHIIYGNSDDVKIGEWVLAVGNPFNLTSTVTAGIVSAKARNINILQNPEGTAIESFIQTDAAVNRGNSGGALVNTRGELIGINAAIASGTGYYTGYSFAIPVNIVKKVVDDFIRFGEVQRAFLGVSIREIDSKLAADEGIDEMKGVYIASISDNGAAKEAGIKEGDIILSVQNVPVNTTSELLEAIGQHRPGEKVSLVTKRKNKEQTSLVTLRNRDGQTNIVKKEERNISSLLGASFEEVSEKTKEQLGIASGVQITRLGAGALADAGVREGFIITKIDGKVVASIADVEKILNNKKGGVLLEGIYPNRMKAYYGFGL
ncbi:MAG: Do family serine endopeptidase [Bacteroidales bacterium]|nr:Do family serine endopeptidase [Bacteroidales bacterium]